MLRISPGILRSLGLSTLLLSMMTVHAITPDEVETSDLTDAEQINCAADDNHRGQLQLARLDCPGGDCGPPDPPEDEPTDPDNPPPTPPPPEIIRTITVPAQFISNTIWLGLSGTVLQVSHTDGDQLTFWNMVQRCQPAPNPGPAECQDRCKDTPPKQLGRCLDQCRNHNQTCKSVCGPYTSLSYLQWGPHAKAQSRKRQCDASTCPACVPATQVPSLRDVDLPVNVFRKLVDPWPAPKFYITCKINRFQFRAEPNTSTGRQHEVSVSTEGLTLRIPGTAGSPGIPCDNAPDVSVEDLGLKLSLRMAKFGPVAVIAKGELEGHFSTVVAGEVVVDQVLKGVFAEVASNRLNAEDKRALFLGLLRDLTDQYIEQKHLDPRVGEVSSIRFSEEGMTVRYLMAPW